MFQYPQITLLIIITLSPVIVGYEKDLWGVIISTSDQFDNYRHSVNSLLMYNILKQNGVPDEHIILALSQFHACDARNFYPGQIILSDNNNILERCVKDVNIGYKEADLHNFQILDILRGRSMNLMSAFRKLKSDKNSRVVVIITSHGGENFIKVREKMVILSDELNRTLNEMYIKERYKELVFIVDTCEGFSLYDSVNVPNIFFVASSLVHQKAKSFSFDDNLMTPTADKFHYLIYKMLQTVNKKKDYNLSLTTFFEEAKFQKEFLTTDVAIVNKIERNLTVGEVFGNPLIQNHPVINLNISMDLLPNPNLDPFATNSLLQHHKEIINKDIFSIKTFSQSTFTLISKPTKVHNSNPSFPLCSLFLFLFISLVLITVL